MLTGTNTSSSSARDPAATNPDVALLLPLALGSALLLMLAAIAAIRLALPQRIKECCLRKTTRAPRKKRLSSFDRGITHTQEIHNHPPPPAENSIDGRYSEQTALADISRQRLLSQLSCTCAATAVNTHVNYGSVHRIFKDVDTAVASTGSLDAALISVVSCGGSVEEVIDLLDMGACVDTAMIGVGCALSIASRRCSSGVVDVLLRHGADVELKDERGWPPLMHAIDAHKPLFSRESVIGLLLSYGASVEVWGRDLVGPFDLLALKLAPE